jgi:two-component sensor histidine kinase
MKNALQLIGSFIRLRARGAANPETKQELALISNQLTALSKIQALLEVNEEPGAVDVVAVLEHLCSRIEAAHGVTLSRDLKGRRMMESGTAARVAIILNELVTNALKHGDGRIRIEVGEDPDAFEMTVANGGRPLSPGFSLCGQTGFGLNAMKSVAESMGAELVAREEGLLGGAEFRLRLPAWDEASAAA